MRRSTYVVATDLSGPSKAALSGAGLLARRTGARLDVFCAVDPSIVANDRTFPDRVRTSVAKLTDRAGAEDARHHVVVAPDAAAAIARHARAVAADLVVVGPHGAGGWRKLLLGSVTERLLRQTPAMLLVVRGRLPEAIGRILVAIDMSPGSTRALRAALDVARATRAKLTALHVVAPPGGALDAAGGVYLPADWSLEAKRVAAAGRIFGRWIRRFPTRGADLETRVVQGGAVDTIVREAKASGAAIVVVGSHGKTAAREFFVGSVAHGVATHCPVSVLVVRAHPRRPLGATKRTRRMAT